ncbi:MAG TPA: carbohydrate kinase family protein [Patescibacteria group bacterium]|nr:carbohydrate kinase family protein [Patescibacteria group bacterium]
MHVLAIGSSVIDLFLDVDPKAVTVDDQYIKLHLGDKISSEIKKITLGGNGANVSVGLTRLEIPTTFYTYLGGDILSREIEEGLTREGVELVAERHEQKSSSLSIIFGFDHDRIIFSHHEVRDYTFSYDKELNFDYIFLSSIGDHWEKAYEQIYEFISKNNIPVAFSPGIHQLENVGKPIKNILGLTKIFLSNREEAEKILGKAGGEIKDLLTGIKEFGPEIVSITDGGNGSFAIDRENKSYKLGPLPSSSSEKTGAGDAYAAAFVAACLSGQDVPTAMVWGANNANAVMERVGAQNGLLRKPELDRRIKEGNNLKAEELQ